MNSEEQKKLANKLLEILNNDYQIYTADELQEAIDKIGPIDISVFCAPLPEKRGPSR